MGSRAGKGSGSGGDDFLAGPEVDDPVQQPSRRRPREEDTAEATQTDGRRQTGAERSDNYATTASIDRDNAGKELARPEQEEHPTQKCIDKSSGLTGKELARPEQEKHPANSN